MEQLRHSDKMKRILEISKKGAEIVKPEDIPLTYELIKEFFNINKNIQEIIKNLEFIVEIYIEGIGTNTFVISNGKAEVKEGKAINPNVTIASDLKTIAQILLGTKDPFIAFFKGELVIDGDLFTVIQYEELLELSRTELNILDRSNKERILELSEVKKLLNVYRGTIKPDDPSLIPSFLKLLIAFVNNNPEALDEIQDVYMKIQLIITHVGSYLIEIKENKMIWREGSAEDSTLIIEMAVDVGLKIILLGDAISPYLAGDISIEGNLQDAMIFSEILQILHNIIELAI